MIFTKFVTKAINRIHEICHEGDKSEPPELLNTLAVDIEDQMHVSQSTAGSINRKSILLAYQDEWLCELIASLLEPEYHVRSVHSGEAFLKSIKENSPNLVILEDELGGMKALDIVKLMKASVRSASIPIFIAFGENSHEDIAKAISLGVEGFTDDKHEILEIVESAKKHLDKPPQTVLIVDDDPMVRELLKHSLTSGGLTVEMASDGIEALDYLSQNDFIPKPFDPEEVLMRVKQHLEAKQKVA